jgi:apolipoprotein N-acyltransferase
VRVPDTVPDCGVLAGLNRRVTAAKVRVRAGIAFTAGLFSVLALAPVFFWPVLFLTLPVFVWLIDGSAPGLEAPGSRGDAVRRAAVAGWWFGFGYFFGGLFWIGEAFLVEKEKFGWALPFAVTLMPAGLALFWGAAAAAARFFWLPGIRRVLVLAVALSAAEWLRGHLLTGFPWNVLGYALTYPLVLMQSAAVLGIYALTLWSVAIFAAPLVVAADGAPGQLRSAALRGVAIAAVPLAILLAYGAARLSEAPAAMAEGVRVRVVQPSVPQREKWRPENQRSIFTDHLDLSRHDATGRRDDLKGITHVVWPEAAMPFLPLEHPEALEAIGELIPEGTYLLTGALRRERAPQGEGAVPASEKLRAYNSLMVFGHGGTLAAVYDKIHLVPFGEYLPFQNVLEAMGFEQLTRMRGGFTDGSAPRPLLSIGRLAPAAGLICYEAIFPGEVVEASRRPGVLVNVTNDGWFGDTTGPRQHFHQARVRAVEEGLPLIRAANNGISAVVDAEGRVLERLGLNERGVIDSGVPLPRPPTLYARFGDSIFACNSLFLVALIIGLSRVVSVRK